MFNMKLLIVLLSIPLFVTSLDELNERKVDYFLNITNLAIQQAKKYKPRVDNGNFFINGTNKSQIKAFGTFNFIVVGCGSSGSVVAARLSEVESFKILLLEAGEFDDSLTEVPYLAKILQYSSKNWDYFSTPQKSGCFGYKGNSCAYPRGKIMGGSGSIEFSRYVRGNRDDYNRWNSSGNPGWSFKDVLPYFKKLENFNSDDIDLDYRGFAGPVDIEYQRPLENSTFIEKSYAEIGIDMIPDYNARKQTGVSRMQLTTKFGERVSGSTAYVREAFRRHNFNLTLSAYVTKILINNISSNAYGVEFVKRGVLYQAVADREVIIAAGVVNTPQLLMVSGVGPEKELKKNGIPLLKNLPVGRILKDQPFVRLGFKINLTTDTLSLRQAFRRFVAGKGILTNFQNGITSSFHNTERPSSPVPNIEIAHYTLSPLTIKIPTLDNYIPAVKEYSDQLDPHKISFFDIYLLDPRSNGSVRLKSNSPVDFPKVDLGILSDPRDIEALYEGIKIVNKIANSTTGREIAAEQIKFKLCSEYGYFSKEYYFCFIKYLASSGSSSSMTAKMGPNVDPLAVVDFAFRVYGITKLRVVDCSVIPTAIAGQFNAVAFMIGEKAADAIKRDNGIKIKAL